jgi:flagellar basal body-associated protein FliL
MKKNVILVVALLAIAIVAFLVISSKKQSQVEEVQPTAEQTMEQPAADAAAPAVDAAAPAVDAAAPAAAPTPAAN